MRDATINAFNIPGGHVYVHTGLLLGEDPATYQQILTQVVAGGAMANYGRDAEREADRLGVRYMHEPGFAAFKRAAR